MKTVFKWSLIGIIIFILLVCYQNIKFINKYIIKNYIFQNENFTLDDRNENSKELNWDVIQITDNFEPKSKKELYNLIYTVLDSGVDEFNFFCNDEYKECENDLDSIARENSSLPYLNNYLHPFNTFKSIHISFNYLNKITIGVNKIYSPQEIQDIKNYLEEYEKQYPASGNIEKDIRKYHDHIINNTSYDLDSADKVKLNQYDENKETSHKANGALLKGSAICGGYSDAMSLYLERLKVPNYRISNTFHIWNYLQLDGKWLHLDLTWDDPVTNSGHNILSHKYYLIDDPKLKSLNSSNHHYEMNVFN